jgi:predicted amidophosphoribosyltransferase
MNTPANQNCPRCQSPIPQEAPGDLCPKCVLEGAALGSQPIGRDVHRHGEAPSMERVADASKPFGTRVDIAGDGATITLLSK